MSINKLFFSKNGWIDKSKILSSLLSVEADSCDILYIHSGLNFGIPNPELKREELINEILEVFIELNVKTLCMPNFTFSFCNNLNFDLDRSRSKMGALNEYFRIQSNAKRSLDPLMSVSIMGDDSDLIENLGNESIGHNSTFEKLSKKDNVKFLFFGTALHDCFTYMHYLEYVAKSKYRYNREFKGLITANGNTEESTYVLFIRYNNVMPNVQTTIEYGDILKHRKNLKSGALGNSYVSCVDERSAKNLYLNIIEKNPNYFILGDFDIKSADTTFIANNMVAL